MPHSRHCAYHSRALTLAFLLSTAAVLPAYAEQELNLETLEVAAKRAEGAEATIEKAQENIQKNPGGVAVVPAKTFQNGAATTTKDMLEYVPGVFAQPKFGEDTRLSIRGSGLSRNFHLRGIQLYIDGVPVNDADGSGDFQEIDPLGVLYSEVFRGANAIRFGSSTLGGAVNFVSPTGRDMERLFGRAELGSWNFRRIQAGSAGAWENTDYFISGTWLKQDGFREHSQGESQRATGNVGYRFSENAETRFYFNLNDIEQRIPGALTRAQALTTPRMASPGNITNDYQRNIESVRVANKTTLTFEDWTANVGAYAAHKQLFHPIFQVIDNASDNMGVFADATHKHQLFGRDSEFFMGAQINGSMTDAKRFVNVGGKKGAPTFASDDSAFNAELYGEYRHNVLPDLSLIAGGQMLYARRETDVEFGGNSGKADFTAINPKVGALWQIDPTWQAFANVSRSYEPPPLSELGASFLPVNPADIKAQSAWTAEIGTRGQRENFTWDATLYRSWVRDELQFIDLGGGASRVENVDATIHQGFELGAGFSVLKGLFATGENPDKLWLNLAYTFSDFTFDNDPTWGGNEIPGAPRHMLRAELMYRHPGGFYAGPNVEWVPEAYFADNANTQETKSYALLGFKTGYEWKNGLSVFVDARNLTDEKYIGSVQVTGLATPASALFNPGSGRAVFGGVKVKW